MTVKGQRDAWSGSLAAAGKRAICMAEWNVPGYTELKTLGSGGFGHVVLAKHHASGALVAIKYLRADLLADPEFARMFRGEAEVLASLNDSNVVRLYEYAESPSGAAIVMELVDGLSLRDILSNQGSTTAEAALVVLEGSLLGLAAAHRRGVVHRDYKPENVLVNGDGVSKLTDFGIAARTGDSPFPAGTIAYAPPEQFNGAPVTPASDVYAATATFYECLAGRPPFSGDTAEALLYQHMSQPVPLDPVPEPLRPLVTTGMAKEPYNRPTDGTSFVAALNAAAIGAYGPDWKERGRSHLGEAALLLAALWPSAASPAVQGSGVERVNMHAAHSQASQPASQPSAESRHIWHVRHLLHLEHLRHLRRSTKAIAAVASAVVVVAAGAAVAVALSGSGGGHGHLTAQSGQTSASQSPSQGPPSPPSTLPAVTGTSPATGPAAGGTLVAIHGTNLEDATMVSFGGVAGMISSDSGSQILVSAPPGKGTVDVSVTTPGGTSTAGMFTYTSASPTPPARPVLTGISPASGAAGGGTSVTITGSGLASAGKVSFGGAAGTITADSGSRITVKSPPGKGTVTVTVTTPGGTATAGKFTYKASSPPPPARPVVTGISPNSGPAAGGTSVTITGKNLSSATGVSFGGAGGKITADSSTRITATSPSGSGTVNITVTTKGGTSATSNADKFTYSVAAPIVLEISPSSGPAGGGTSVTITGTNLSNATGVSFGGSGGRITADSSTQITATSPSGSGTVDITVTTAGGTSVTTNGDRFTYIAAPAITTLRPNSGSQGTTVYIIGSNLSGVTSVSFGGVGATITSNPSSEEVVVTAPSGSGTVNVTVTTAGGTSNALQFTYEEVIQ
jgi:serine/threonine protein kinase